MLDIPIIFTYGQEYIFFKVSLSNYKVNKSLTFTQNIYGILIIIFKSYIYYPLYFHKALPCWVSIWKASENR